MNKFNIQNITMMFLNRNLQQISWFIYIVAFLIGMQSWTTATRSGNIGIMTAATSVKFPGEVYPKSSSILIGDNANITCHLSKPNSLDIWFLEEKSQRAIKQPTDKIKVVDPYTAVLMIHNADEQNSRFQCKVEDYAIGESELYAGTAPQNITDFACISYDYEYMECSFTRPRNMVLTRFDLEYKLPKDNSIYKCDCQDLENYKVRCNVADYLPMRESYLFTLKGTNDVGENVQQFEINNHKIVVPSAVDIIKRNVTSESIALSLEKLKISYYIKIGLTYDIQIRDNYSSWQIPEMGDLECQNGTCNIVISNLYAFWFYWIKVRIKSNAVENNDFWSDTSIISFRTKSERPKRPPETPLGSFYIDSTETQLRLYWEQMPENEQNGPGFHYVINELKEHNVKIPIIKTNESSVTLAWRNESMQTFLIKSANDRGESSGENIIRVYRSGSSRNELNENYIAKVYHNGSYILSWTPPENLKDLMNYTVFWCLQKIELPNQCKGSISYKYLDKFTTNFSTEPKDRSLNLAISANYANYNKGMQWAQCSGDISIEFMKMDLEVYSLNESAILVKWSSGSVCPSILKGYNLTYCQASVDDNCVKAPITIELLREKQEYRNYTISDLPPFTNLCLYMFMYSSNKQGRISDLNCIRTKESAPSPPRNIKYIKNTITSKSAEIIWSPPDASNGILSHYSIYWRKYPHHTFEKNTTSFEHTSYSLTGLSSYSNYEVYVTAHTIKESVPSKRINFTTLIGIPSGPRNLNIYENDSVIYWDQPDLPSGKHLFYVVALIRRDEKFNSFYERASIVKGRSCRFQQPDCLNSNKSYALKVRALNVGGIEEVDREIVAIKKDVILDGAPIDENFCVSDDEEGEESFDINTRTVFQNDIGKFYFASPWIVAPRSYSCWAGSKASIYAVALIIVIAFAAYLCCWLRNKYYKMKNIKVILPEGLVDQVSNYKFGTNALDSRGDLGSSANKEFRSDISRSNDCLVSYGHTNNFNVITNSHNGSINALSSLSSNSSSKDNHKEEQFEEQPSLETTNEELSSNSSSGSNSNFTYHDQDQITKLPSDNVKNVLHASVPEVEKETTEQSIDNSQHFVLAQNNDYVTHNSQLLASILNNAERHLPPTTPHIITTFPTMTNDGYIQPSAAKQLPTFSLHQPSTTPINGYTCIESLGKVDMQNEARQINTAPNENTPASNATITNTFSLHGSNVTLSILPRHHTSPVITDTHVSPTFEYKKATMPLNDAPISPTITSQQPNNNKNSIYGYVTQQQLANFGTNVALGKELNT